MNKKHKKRKNNNCLPYVVVGNQSIERAISQFKKRVKNAEILKELKDRQYYTKPSEERREKKNRAKRRNYYQRLRDEKSF